MQQIDWRLTGALVLSVIAGIALIALAWQAAKLVLKLLLAFLILILTGAAVWLLLRHFN